MSLPKWDADFQDRESILRLWYGKYYSTTSVTANGSFFEKYMHRAMEAPFGRTEEYPRVLEVGGNRGEHVPYVRHRFDDYVLTDLYEPNLTDVVGLDDRVQVAAADVQSLPYADAEFDRVIATCLLHHVPDPFLALLQMRRVVKPGGRITILLPTDPGVGYRTAQRVTSGRKARKQEIGPFLELVHAVDHINHFESLVKQLDYVFRADEVHMDWKPTKLPSWNINLFTVVQIRRA